MIPAVLAGVTMVNGAEFLYLRIAPDRRRQAIRVPSRHRSRGRPTAKAYSDRAISCLGVCQGRPDFSKSCVLELPWAALWCRNDGLFCLSEWIISARGRMYAKQNAVCVSAFDRASRILRDLFGAGVSGGRQICSGPEQS